MKRARSSFNFKRLELNASLFICYVISVKRNDRFSPKTLWKAQSFTKAKIPHGFVFHSIRFNIATVQFNVTRLQLFAIFDLFCKLDSRVIMLTRSSNNIMNSTTFWAWQHFVLSLGQKGKRLTHSPADSAKTLCAIEVTFHRTIFFNYSKNLIFHRKKMLVELILGASSKPTGLSLPIRMNNSQFQSVYYINTFYSYNIFLRNIMCWYGFILIVKIANKISIYYFIQRNIYFFINGFMRNFQCKNYVIMQSK